jgi:hypothetical protein
MRKHLSATASPSFGFSLIEVTLAMAICALAVITLLGLIPQGMELSRKTSQMTDTSYIIEQIMRDLEGSTWTSLTQNKSSSSSSGAESFVGTETRYYDLQASSVSKDSSQIVYIAAFSFFDAQMPSDGTAQSNLIRVMGRVASTSNPEFNFSRASPASYFTFYDLISRTRGNLSDQR